MEDLLTWAQKKNFTQAHIGAFISQYEIKKFQAIKDKSECEA
jgi:hypothetical protein